MYVIKRFINHDNARGHRVKMTKRATSYDYLYDSS